MSIYDKSYKSFAFVFESKKARTIALSLLLVFFLLALIFFASMLFKAKLIEAKLLDNPLDLQVKPYTLLEVKITNITESDASDVSVIVEAANKEAIFIGPGLRDEKKLSVIEKGQYRKLYFLVVPKSTIAEGSYLINIKVVINNKTFEDSIPLIVKPR